MVMMGQQLMNSERKQEDDEIDDYVLKPPNSQNIRSPAEEQKQLNPKENMKKGQIPTLAALAQLTHQKHRGGTWNKIVVASSEGNSNTNCGSEEYVSQEAIPCCETSTLNGDDGHHRPEQDGLNDCQASAAGGGEATTASSGRTSSCDSSGIGHSLTSSSSSDRIEREETVSPSSDKETGTAATNAPSVSQSDSNIDVPDNGISNGVVENGSPCTETNNIPNGGVAATASDSCQALLLCKDYNEQMTAAKKFLKMVRDGINENGKSVAAATATSRNRGGESLADEDKDNIVTSSTTPNSKSAAILSNLTPINNNSLAACGVAVNIKEKYTLGGGRPPLVTSKIPTSVPVLAAAAALNQHTVLEKARDEAPTCVQEVWAHNLLEEFAKIRKVVRKYTYIAMDTEFPGIVVRPQCAVRGAGVFPYELLKLNVDRLKIIQLGVTFMDKDGKCPPGVCTWQFNFKFSLNKDLYASDSISLLTRCGIQFERHAEMGIDPEKFGEYFMSSGMVTSDHVTYLTFHSGFDFGYLIKLLSNLPLPDNEDKFFEIMKIYFPNVYDLKFLMKSVDLHGGLQDIANQMGQERVGTQHQAGSDSLLTGMTFFKLLSTDVFNGAIDPGKYCGKLYGFHMNDDGTKDEGWSEITGENLLDSTSPKPPFITSRIPPNGNIGNSSTVNGTSSNPLPTTTQLQQSSHHSSSASAAGTSSDAR